MISVDHNHGNHNSTQSRYTLKQFFPLIIIFLVIIALTAAKGFLFGPFTWHTAMYDFMGFFFIVFGAFKLINLQKFVEAYRVYDIVAQRSVVYAYVYPFIECMLGIIYLMHMVSKAVLVFTFILMLVSACGVALELRKGKEIMCACLGAVFRVPMTYVTLLEDIVMAAMALYMLIKV